MEFYKFMQLLYNFAATIYTNQTEFFKDILNSAVNENIEDLFQHTKQGTISKYMNGKISISVLAKKVLANMDKENLIACFDRIFHKDEQIRIFEETLKKNGADFEYFDETEDIANFFYNLLVNETQSKKKKKICENINSKNDEIDILQPTLAAKANAPAPAFINVLNNINAQFQAADITLTNNLPENIKKDFEYKIIQNDRGLNPELIPKTKDALHNHKFKYKCTFKSKDEANKFRLNVQKSEILKQLIEIKPNKIERYIDDFKDEFYDSNRYMLFVGPVTNESPILEMKLELNNNHFKEVFDNLVLTVKEINNNLLIYSNTNDDNWMSFTLIIDCSNYEKGNVEIRFNIEIKKEYLTNIEYLKEFYKLRILLSDNNTHITLLHIPTNNLFINRDVIDGVTYTDEDYKDMQKMFNSYEKISKIQKITNTIFEFNQDEFNKYKPTYDIAYACVTGENITLKTNMEVEILVPNENIKEYKLGYKKDITNETDNINIFDKKIEFKECLITLKDAEIINILQKDDCYIVRIKTNLVEIKGT